MYYPSRILLPKNISKHIPLSIKQTWVHYPNLCATKICYRTFFKGSHQWKPTQLINGEKVVWPVCLLEECEYFYSQPPHTVITMERQFSSHLSHEKPIPRSAKVIRPLAQSNDDKCWTQIHLVNSMRTGVCDLQTVYFVCFLWFLQCVWWSPCAQVWICNQEWEKFPQYI